MTCEYASSMRTMSHMKVRTATSGFTLIEILIVIVIIGILSTIGLGAFKSTQEKSRDSRRKSDIKNISTALEVYYNDKRRFPDASGGDIVACGGQACDAGAQMADGPTVYMVQFPGDPSSNQYYYETDVEGSYFRLYARLENLQDRQSAQAGGEPGEYSGTDCGAAACNFGMTSSNESLPAPVAAD